MYKKKTQNYNHAMAGVHKIFQKPMRQLNILGARRAPRSKFDLEGPQISDTTAKHLGLRNLISTFGICKRFSFSLLPPKMRLGPTKKSYSNHSIKSFFPIVKSTETLGYSLPCSAEFKNEWSCTSTPSIRFHVINRKKFP